MCEKVTKCQKGVPEEDIIALVVASLPQDLLNRIIKEEEMIEKGWEETKKLIVREAERHRKLEPAHGPFTVSNAGWKQIRQSLSPIAALSATSLVIASGIALSSRLHFLQRALIRMSTKLSDRKRAANGDGGPNCAPNHYGPTSTTQQAHAVSVSCIKCLQKGYLAIVCPFHVK